MMKDCVGDDLSGFMPTEAERKEVWQQTRDRRNRIVLRRKQWNNRQARIFADSGRMYQRKKEY